MPHQRAATEAMLWKNTDYEVLNTIRDGYFFAGASWNRQTAKRFILKNKRVQNVIEASYYLHLADHDKPVNVAFEPSTSFGCSVGCLFCASGTLFPIKALRAEEITEQVNTLILSYRDDFPYVHTTVREDVFYSGIGEPTLMMNTLIEASKQILTQHPHLQFKISTMGANPSALIRWAHSGLPLRSVQIGIPHYDNEKIKTLYSQCKKYDLEAVLAAIKEFMVIRPETAIKINYIGIKDFNDSRHDLIKTVTKITEQLGYHIELKLSCLNPTHFAKANGLMTLTVEELNQLARAASSFQLKNVYTFGPMTDKKLGCGQLAWNYTV